MAVAEKLTVTEVRGLARQAGMQLREQVTAAGKSHYSLLRGKKEVHHAFNLNSVAKWLDSWLQHVR